MFSNDKLRDIKDVLDSGELTSVGERTRHITAPLSIFGNSPYNTVLNKHLMDYLTKVNSDNTDKTTDTNVDTAKNVKTEGVIQMKRATLNKLLSLIENDLEDVKQNAIDGENPDAPTEEDTEESAPETEEVPEENVEAQEDKLEDEVKQEMSNFKTYVKNVNYLMHNIIEMTLQSYVPTMLGTKAFTVMTESMYKSVVNKNHPVEWNKLSGTAKNKLIENIALIRDTRDQLIENFSSDANETVIKHAVLTEKLITIQSKKVKNLTTIRF